MKYVVTLAAAVSLCWPAPGLLQAQVVAQVAKDKVIARAQRTPVSALDSALPKQRPKQRFDDWFRKLVGSKAEIRWEANDCGEQTGSPADQGRDFPVCAEAVAVLSDGRNVAVLIGVGTVKKGITGRPVVRFVSIEQGGRIHRVLRLRDLPEKLRAHAKK